MLRKRDLASGKSGGTRGEYVWWEVAPTYAHSLRTHPLTHSTGTNKAGELEWNVGGDECRLPFVPARAAARFLSFTKVFLYAFYTAPVLFLFLTLDSDCSQVWPYGLKIPWSSWKGRTTEQYPTGGVCWVNVVVLVERANR